jgi:hypothetical protein
MCDKIIIALQEPHEKGWICLSSVVAKIRRGRTSPPQKHKAEETEMAHSHGRSARLYNRARSAQEACSSIIF